MRHCRKKIKLKRTQYINLSKPLLVQLIYNVPLDTTDECTALMLSGNYALLVKGWQVFRSELDPALYDISLKEAGLNLFVGQRVRITLPASAVVMHPLHPIRPKRSDV